MKTTFFATALVPVRVCALAGALFAGIAGAAPIQIDVPQHVHPVESTLTRAEVAADYHMWRLAGLQELNQGDRPVDTNSYEYRRAFAIYSELRASPQFATLVHQLQQSSNSLVVAREPGLRVAGARH